ncbi:MAG: 4Fe-4S binding protein [Synergistaceae bacterium]|nr:4Fe-4S binding protein [Synergistaceae bacterium]
MSMAKNWKDKMWIVSIVYFSLGFFNIIFAWLGMLCFIIPILMSVFGKEKNFCNGYCGRGQLFTLIGANRGISLNRELPAFLKSRWFRYGFLLFFMIMFLNMLFATWAVFAGNGSLNESVKLFWTFDLPWKWANRTGGKIPLWTVQFAYGFYSLMLTSLILGLMSMLVFRPRAWCVYCPMGTATQMICKIREGEGL